MTELLLGQMPHGMVLAVDASENMVEAARRRFAGELRVRMEHQDLLLLDLGRPVDVIFSTTTFHWIKEHDLLFERLARALKPGGRLVAQCGGQGNIARTLAVMGEDRFRDAFVGWEGGWYFADPETTKARLEAAGFDEVETWLHEEFTEFSSVDELARFLKTVVLRQHLTFLPESERDPSAAAVVARLAGEGSLVVDYVRLNMLATRPVAA